MQCEQAEDEEVRTAEAEKVTEQKKIYIKQLEKEQTCFPGTIRKSTHTPHTHSTAHTNLIKVFLFFLL